MVAVNLTRPMNVVSADQLQADSITSGARPTTDSVPAVPTPHLRPMRQGHGEPPASRASSTGGENVSKPADQSSASTSVSTRVQRRRRAQRQALHRRDRVRSPPPSATGAGESSPPSAKASTTSSTAAQTPAASKPQTSQTSANQYDAKAAPENDSGTTRAAASPFHQTEAVAVAMARLRNPSRREVLQHLPVGDAVKASPTNPSEDSGKRFV